MVNSNTIDDDSPDELEGSAKAGGGSAQEDYELSALRDVLERAANDDDSDPLSDSAHDQLIDWIHARSKNHSTLQHSSPRSPADHLDWQMDTVSELLDETLADYQYAFIADDHPVIRDFVRTVPQLAQRLFAICLIAKDVELRTQRAQLVAVEDYTAQFPELKREIQTIIGQPSPDLPVLASDRYRLLRVWRPDRSGEAYIAEDRRFRRLVVVRFLDFNDYEEYQQFYHECWVAPTFQHANLTKIFDQGIAQGQGYVVHELVTGPSLTELYQRETPSPRQAARWCLDIAQLLRAARQHDGRHYPDLRPEQFMVDSDNKLKLFDSRLGIFPPRSSLSAASLARRRRSIEDRDFQWSSLTELTGKHHTDSNAFHLGALLFFLLTGQSPFPNSSTLQDALNQRLKDPPSPQTLQQRVPESLAKLCQQACTSVARQRLLSVDEFAQELSEILDESTSSTSRPTNRQAESHQKIPQQTIVAGHYVIDQLLGRGGWGDVWRALDTRDGRHVALKLLKFNSDHQQVRFLREAKMSAALKHSHIVKIYEHGTSDKQDYIAYELIEGPTLTDEIATRGLPDPRVAAQWCRDIALAIHCAHSHEKQVIHRDLKPGNIMLDAHQQIKVLDFGLALYLNPDSIGDLSISHHGKAEFRGTMRWTSPEQLEGLATPLSDLHGIGSILYFLLTGECPFGGNDIDSAIEKRQHAPPSIRQRFPHVPLELEQICFQALQFNPDHRHVSAAQLAEELDQFLARTPPPIPKESLLQKIWSLIFPKRSATSS